MPHRTPAPLALITIAAALSASTPTPAHADPLIDAALADLRATYSTAAICERVGVQVRAGPVGQTRISQAGYLLRLAPAGPDGRPHLALELQQYLLEASSGQLTLAHQRDPSTYFRAPIPEQLSARALLAIIPPVPIPQLDLAAPSPDPLAPDPTRWSAITPYAAGITWTSLETDPRSTSARTLRGAFAEGRVTAILRGSRLHTLTIDRDEPRVTIRMTFAPVPACEPGRTLIDTRDRTRVDSILDLRPRAGQLAIDQPLPPVKISAADGAPWVPADLLESPPDAVIAGIPPAEHAVLIFTRVQPPGALPTLTRIDFDRLGQALRELRAAAFQPPPSPAPPTDAPEPPPRFGFARVLVFNNPPPDQVISAIQSAARTWGMRQTLWAAAPADSIDLLAPGAEAVAVVVDSTTTLRAVIAITPDTSTDALEGQILSTLFELFAPRGSAVFSPQPPPKQNQPSP